MYCCIVLCGGNTDIYVVYGILVFMYVCDVVFVVDDMCVYCVNVCVSCVVVVSCVCVVCVWG